MPFRTQRDRMWMRRASTSFHGGYRIHTSRLTIFPSALQGGGVGEVGGKGIEDADDGGTPPAPERHGSDRRSPERRPTSPSPSALKGRGELRGRLDVRMQ